MAWEIESHTRNQWTHLNLKTLVRYVLISLTQSIKIWYGNSWEGSVFRGLNKPRAEEAVIQVPKCWGLLCKLKMMLHRVKYLCGPPRLPSPNLQEVRSVAQFLEPPAHSHTTCATAKKFGILIHLLMRWDILGLTIPVPKWASPETQFLEEPFCAWTLYDRTTKFDTITSCGRGWFFKLITSQRDATPGKIILLHSSCKILLMLRYWSGKNYFKNLCICIVMWITTKILWLAASHTLHPSKNFIKISP